MKKNGRNNIRLGLFVSLSIFLLIAGIYFIGSRQQLFGRTFRIHGIFKDINGLQVGNNVRFSGITVGVVENICQISDTSVKVDMFIDEDSRKFIKTDAIAIVGSDGLMGNKIIVISPGGNSKTVIKNNDVIQTAIPINMDDILQKLKITSENSASITQDLAVISESVRNGKGTIGMLFMDTTFSQNLSQAMEKIKEGAGGFKKNMDKAGNSYLLKGRIRDKK